MILVYSTSIWSSQNVQQSPGRGKAPRHYGVTVCQKNEELYIRMSSFTEKLYTNVPMTPADTHVLHLSIIDRMEPIQLLLSRRIINVLILISGP